MKIPLVDLKKQYLGIKAEIDEAIASVIADTAFIGGRYVASFEEAFAAYCSVKHCVGVGNGTDAIYIALRALGITRGDEVITVANSFIATSEAIGMTGAKVVFVDCDPQSHNIDVVKLGEAITPRTKAIVPVHLYGLPANMPVIKEIADRHGIFVVEDAAQAHGGEIRGRRVGSFGHASCFSFFPGKNLGAYGDAGAIVTSDETLARQCRMIANHGRIQKYDHAFEGVNSRLDALHAAILSVKLRHLEAWTERRREIASWYRSRMDSRFYLSPAEVDGFRHVYHLYVIRVKNRDSVQAGLHERGIATGIHYPCPLPHLSAYSHLGHAPGDFPVSEAFSKEILSLPMYPELAQAEVEYVCSNLEALTSSGKV
jgi:dTDP-4-amino-4,6-dideoxygalactose transaminase